MSDRSEHDAWDDLAHARLDDEERAVLRALAEDDDAMDAKLRAFTPLGASFEDAVVARVATQQRGRRLRRALRAPALAALAAAALALVALLPRAVEEDGAAVLPGDERALPSFTLSLSAGARTARGGEAADERIEARPRPVFAPSTRVEIVLAPAERTRAETVAAIYLWRGGEPRWVRGELARAETGALRLEGDGASLFGDAPRGRWTLVAVVGRSLPSASAVREALEEGRDEVEGAAILRTELELAPSAEGER